jgi:putative ABC transport system permease protein
VIGRAWRERRARRRAQAERLVDEELAFHFDRSSEELARSGVTGDEAVRAVRQRFGRLDRHRPALVRHTIGRLAGEQRRAAMQVFLTSLKTVGRGFLRTPGFTLGVVAILTLGLGVNAITFALVDRLVLSGPAGIDDPGSLYRAVAHRHNRSGVAVATTDFSYVDYRELLASPQAAGVLAESQTPLLFGRGDDAGRVQARLVTASYFGVLGVSPAVGRFFTADESERDGARLVVLSHQFWTRQFGGDPSVLGRGIEIESHRYTVIGVTPPRFTGTDVSKVDVFLPLEAAADEQISGTWRTGFNIGWIQPIVRLAPGATPDAAAAQMTAAYRAARRGSNGDDPRAVLALEPLTAVRGVTASTDIGVAALLWGVALLVLAIAAANVANLFLARALRQADQLAVRMALGAGRARVVLEEAAQGALLALAGAAVAVVVAVTGVPLVQRLLFPDVDWLDTAVDLRGLLFIAACAVVGGSLAAALPMWRAGRLDILSWLRTGSRAARARSRVQSAMLMVQGALSVLLLVAAGLFVKSLETARQYDLGIAADRLLVLSAVRGDTPPRPDFRDEWRARVSRIRGVEATTRVAGTLPFVSSWAVPLAVPGLAEKPTLQDGGPYIHAVEAGYFDIAGTRIVDGRPFTSEDRDGAPRVAIVNETMARLYWPGQPAIGQCLQIGPGQPPCATVVGVAQNTRRQTLTEGESLLYYIPLDQAPPELRNAPRLVVRTVDDRLETFAAIAEASRRQALAIEPGLRLVSARPIEDIMAPQLRAWRMGAGLFSVFGALALIVAGIGLYSVVAFEVEGRRREMGVRSALGAPAASIVRLVVADGLRLAAGGVLLGLAAAWLGAPQIGALLFRVEPHDVSVFAGVAAVLMAAALVASAIPGLRAARIDPCRALRSE